MTTKKTIGLSLVLVLLLIILGIGVTYAYFTAVIQGSETASTITVSAGTMSITYAGVATGTVQTPANIYPKSDAWVTKNFTVTGTNTTTADMAYQIVLQVMNNTFSNGALKYKLTGTNTGNNGTVINVSTQTDIASGASSITLGNTAKGKFVNASGAVHTYKLEIFFPDTLTKQDDEQGASFAGYVKIVAVQA